MSTTVIFNGTTYTLPTNGDVDWGTQLSALLAAVGTSVVAIATSTAGQSFASSSGLTQVNFNTVEADTHSAFTTGASAKFTAPLAGYYHIDASMHFAGVANSETIDLHMALYLNGAQKSRLNLVRYVLGTSGFSPGITGGTTLLLAAGDVIDVRLSQLNGSSAAYALSTTATAVRVAIHRI